MNVKATQRDIEYIIKATKAGMTVRAIAEEVGLSLYTVNKFQRLHGVKKENHVSYK